jgi:hypothetical protein
MKTEIVSFYCDIDNRTYYSDHAARLRINCNENNIPHDIKKMKSRGEYRLNCLAKPKFLLKTLEHKKKPFVWLDVDSIIHAELKVFDDLHGKCDMAFAYDGMPPHVKPTTPKASPIYINYTPIAIEFLKTWVDACEGHENSEKGIKVFDHEILMHYVMPKYLGKMRIGMLGQNYAIWPGNLPPDGTVAMITIGVADGESKEKSLREMGLTEELVKYNLVGNKK